MSGENILFLLIKICDQEKRKLSTKQVMANLRKLDAYKRLFFLAISYRIYIRNQFYCRWHISSIEDTQKFHFSDLVAYKRSVSWMQSLSYFRGLALRRMKREFHDAKLEANISGSSLGLLMPSASLINCLWVAWPKRFHSLPSSASCLFSTRDEAIGVWNKWINLKWRWCFLLF